MPLNFLNLGLISRLFPDAPVIHCMRDPLDTCLSCYLTEPRAGHGFAADLTTLAHFHIQYRRLMDHWKQVLDHPILEVSYEAMIEDPDPLAHRMLAFLGFAWDPRRDAPVCRSSERTSVGRWKLYKSHLELLLSELKKPATRQTP